MIVPDGGNVFRGFGAIGFGAAPATCPPGWTAEDSKASVCVRADGTRLSNAMAWKSYKVTTKDSSGRLLAQTTGTGTARTIEERRARQAAPELSKKLPIAGAIERARKMKIALLIIVPTVVVGSVVAYATITRRRRGVQSVTA